MFNLDRQLSGEDCAQMVRRQGEESNEQAQRDIYDSHRHRVFAVGYYMTGSEIEAEKVLEGSFIKAFSRSQRPGQEQVDASLVEELKERVDLQEQGAAVSVRPEDEIQQRNVLKTDLEEAMQTLPSREKLVFLLRDVEGYTPDRVATLLETDAAEVNKLLITARLRIRIAVVRLAAERAARAA